MGLDPEALADGRPRLATGDDGALCTLLPPDAYDLGEIGLPSLRCHPAHLVTAESQTMLGLWRAWQGSGFGPGALPWPGGLMNQPEATLRAFEIMTAAENAFRRPTASAGPMT